MKNQDAKVIEEFGAAYVTRIDGPIEQVSAE